MVPSMSEVLRGGGVSGVVVVLVAAFALVFGVSSVVLAVRGRDLRRASLLAGLALFLSGASGLVGFGATLAGLARTKAVVAASGLSKTDAARLSRGGAVEARASSRRGLAFSVVPFLVGAVGASIALFSAGKGGKPREGSASSEGGDSPSPHVAPVLGGAAAAVTGLLASGGLSVAAVGGADYEPAIWALMARTDAVLNAGPGHIKEACAGLESALGGDAPGRSCGARIDLDLSAVGDLPAAAEACVTARTAEMAAAGGGKVRDGGAALRCSATYSQLTPRARADAEKKLE